MMDLPEADRMFGGRLRLHQPPAGHRAGTDGVLLAAAIPPDARRIADLGASSGLVGLRAAQTNPDAAVHLFDRDAQLCALARANSAANGLAARVEVVERDLLAPQAMSEFREHFDCVLTNPPFHESGRTRMPQNKRAAYVMPEAGAQGGLDLWIRRAASVLAPRGRLAVIHRADAVQALLAAMDRRLGAFRLIFVHPKADQPAIRVLAGAIKGSRAPLAILPPLILHEPDGRFTPQAENLNRGGSGLPLFR